MGGKGSGRGCQKRPEESEEARCAGEQAKSKWWTLFKPWVLNHLDDPVLTLEAAFMDGFRQGLKHRLNDESDAP